MEYSILQCGQPVGVVQLIPKGLYYQIHCRFKAVEGGAWYLVAVGEKARADLGLCVPKDDQWGLDITVPARRLGFEVREFQVKERCESSFYTVEPFAPFSQLWRLEQAVYREKAGAPGLEFPSERVRPTGQ